jgi:tRNA G37 N-methylase Trm5
VTGGRVLDLGAGSGIVGIAAAKAGAREVIAAEIDRYALAALGLNSELNGVEAAARAAHSRGDQLWMKARAAEPRFMRRAACMGMLATTSRNMKVCPKNSFGRWVDTGC